jgi:hypothetical protein
MSVRHQRYPYAQDNHQNHVRWPPNCRTMATRAAQHPPPQRLLLPPASVATVAVVLIDRSTNVVR